MSFIGIDPGQSGGIAAVTVTGPVGYAIPMPETEADVVHALRAWAVHVPPIMVAIEHVTPMPKQGLGSTWKFGQHYGMLRGILAALGWRYILVRPQVWQKELGCLSHGDKRVTKGMAQRLFPGLRITHATADALLIAEWCRRIYGRTMSYAEEDRSKARSHQASAENEKGAEATPASGPGAPRDGASATQQPRRRLRFDCRVSRHRQSGAAR